MADLAGAEKQADLDFNSGFTLETPPAEKPAVIEVKPEAKKPETIKKPEPKAAPKDAPAVEAQKPEYVQITKEQFERLESSATKTADFEKQLSKLFGTTGEMQQIVKKLQAVTPAGTPIELPKGSFANMRKDFPDLADLLVADMSEALKGMRGTGTETKASEPDPEAMRKLIDAATARLQDEALEDAHPKWREIVGTDKDGNPIPNNPFRMWLDKQPAEYKAKINSTNSAAVISKAIDKFLASKAVPAKAAVKPAPKVIARQAVIKGAIQPKGDGGKSGANKPVDDFAEGFANG